MKVEIYIPDLTQEAIKDFLKKNFGDDFHIGEDQIKAVFIDFVNDGLGLEFESWYGEQIYDWMQRRAKEGYMYDVLYESTLK